MAFSERDVERCRLDFPALGRTQDGIPIAYLDGPAGSQVPSAVLDAVSGYYRTCNANTHGAFATSRESDALIRATRETVAAFLGAASWREISFGANMTTLTFALSRALGRELTSGDEIVITALDHEANRGPWLALEERGAVVREVALLPNGCLDERDLRAKITARTKVAAIGFASNALGTVNDVALARELTRQVGAFLVVDAVHYAPHFALDVSTLDPDFLLCSAYKFYGPHVGILYTRPGLLEALRTDRLKTQDDAAPYRIETGTLNHAAIAGVKAAVEYIASWGDGGTLRERIVSAMAAIGAHERTLAASCWEAFRRLKGVTVWGPDFGSGKRAPTVSITIDGVTPSQAADALGRRGVLVWDGDFYAARAIQILGLRDRGGVIRSGFLMYASRAEADRLVAGVAELARG